MTRAVIAAAGGPGRWWTADLPRHLIPVPPDGTPLLARTIAQVRRYTADVHVTVPPADWRFRLSGATLHERGEDFPSEFASTRTVWSGTDRTVLLLGDVYWTEKALSRVMGCRDRDFRVFGRRGPSRHTGTPYGEIFAVSWWPAQVARLDRLLRVVHDTRAAGTVTRPPGWMLLRAWQGTPLGKHRTLAPWWVQVDDLTDDIDRPDDLARHPVFRQAGGG